MILLRTRRSRPPGNASNSDADVAPGGTGLDVRGVGSWDTWGVVSGVVPGVERKVREVATEVAADVGGSDSGVDCRSRSFCRKECQISRMTREVEDPDAPAAWVSSGGSTVRLLGELVTSFNPELSSSLRLFRSFILNVPKSVSS